MTSSAMKSTPCAAQMRCNLAKHLGRIHEHAAGSQHQRLDMRAAGVSARQIASKRVERGVFASGGGKRDSLTSNSSGS